MKLSKKGVEKVSTNCKNVMVIGTDDFFPPNILEGAENLEFDQSDFTGAVVLTVEEAKTVSIAVQALIEICSSANLRRPELWNLYRLIVCRIEQAEKSNG